MKGVFKDFIANMNDPTKYAVAGILPRLDTADIMREFCGEMKAMHGRIMDIGCGPGNVTRDIILPYLPDDAVIVGTDISPVMIEYAEQFNKDEKRINFLQLNIETIELPRNLIGNFDHTVSFYCLHWCQKTKIYSHNIYKLLQPGGTALIAFLSYHTGFDIYLKHQNDSKYSAYLQDAPSYIAPQYGLPNPEESLRKDLEEAGFEVEHCTNRWKTATYKNLDAYLDLLISVNPFFNQMPEELQKEYRNDVGQEIKKKYSIDGNHINLHECPIVDKYSILVAYFKKPALL